MKRTKICLLIASLLLLIVLPISLGSCDVGENCTHPNLQLIEAPTKTRGGLSACLDCNSGEAHVNLPALTDADFYDVEVVDNEE